MGHVVNPQDRPSMLFPHYTTGNPCEHCGGDGWESDQKLTGESLRSHRRTQGKSAKEVASAMGISQQYLSDLEHGRRGWTRTLTKAFYAACRAGQTPME